MVRRRRTHTSNQVRTSPCSGENRSQAQISQRSVQEVNNFHGFCSLFQLSLFFSKASEVMVIYLIEYEWREAFFRTSESCIVVYSIIDLAIHYKFKKLHLHIHGCIAVYRAVMSPLTRFSWFNFSLHTELWHWAGWTRWMMNIWSCWSMKLCYYIYSQ